MFMQQSTVKKSNFKGSSSSKPGVASSEAVASSEENLERKTTHYAYTLATDADGRILKNAEGKATKEFISSDVLQVYENEFSTKLRILGPLPTGDLFIAKHKPKA